MVQIDILIYDGTVKWDQLYIAKRAKINKLKKWSNIPNLENI